MISKKIRERSVRNPRTQSALKPAGVKIMRPTAGFHVDKPPNHSRYKLFATVRYNDRILDELRCVVGGADSFEADLMTVMLNPVRKQRKCQMWTMVFLILVEPNYYWFKSVSNCRSFWLPYTDVPCLPRYRGSDLDYFDDYQSRGRNRTLNRRGLDQGRKVETMIGCLILEQPIGKANCVALKKKKRKRVFRTN